jgi:hypothetical protein
MRFDLVSTSFQKRQASHGPSAALTHQQQADARQHRAEGAILKELARSYEVSAATISRLGQ